MGLPTSIALTLLNEYWLRESGESHILAMFDRLKPLIGQQVENLKGRFSPLTVDLGNGSHLHRLRIICPTKNKDLMRKFLYEYKVKILDQKSINNEVVFTIHQLWLNYSLDLTQFRG